jgi:phosphoketolase
MTTATQALDPESLRKLDLLFTSDKPIIFAYHGYPWLLHRLTFTVTCMCAATRKKAPPRRPSIPR